MSTASWPVCVFAEPDYCYGAGALTMRVERIEWAAPVRYDGEDWYHVDGVELDFRGVESRHRRVLVRGRRLPRPGTPGATTDPRRR